MPLQSSGPISFADIRDEFGGLYPVSLNSYFAGGGNVDFDNFVTANAAGGNIPTGGPVSLQDFMGTTKGNRYYNYTESFTIKPLPANTTRAQVWALGGGGGGAGRVRNLGIVVVLASAGGGGGGYSAAGTIAAIQGNGDYITGEVGGGGAAASGSGDGTTIAGAGGTSIVRVRNSAGTIIRNSIQGNGGGGGLARTTTGESSGGTGGAGGTGTTANGGAGQSSGRGPSNTTGGDPGSTAIGAGGKGGNGSTSSAETAGTGGRIRVRI